MGPNRIYKYLQKVDQRICCFFWFFLQHPMTAVFDNDYFHIGRDQLNLASESFAIRLFSTERQHRHGQLRFCKFFEIFCRLRKGNEITPARMNASRTRVCGGVSLAQRFGDGMILIGSEVVPIVLEVDSLASCDESFGSRPIETEMPDRRVVVNGLPIADSWKKCIHENQLLDVSGELRSVGVRHHESNIVADHACLFDAKRLNKRMDATAG